MGYGDLQGHLVSCFLELGPEFLPRVPGVLVNGNPVSEPTPSPHL